MPLKFPCRKPAWPPIPPEVDLLRAAVRRIDPGQVYELCYPDGSTFRTSGREMIKTAQAYLALADAQQAGNKRGMARAIAKILEGT